MTRSGLKSAPVRPALSHASDGELARRSTNGDRAARDQLVERLLPLAWHLASRYRRSGESIEDLRQVAALGLVKAIERFDPKRGKSVNALVFPYVLGELKRHLRDATWPLHVPRGAKELSLKAEKVSDRLANQLGRPAGLDEIAEALEVEPERISDGLAALDSRHPESLDKQVLGEPDAPSVGEMVGRDDAGFAHAEDRLLANGALEHLDERERQAVVLRFGGDLPQSEIARRLGVSQMHVSRILRRALESMRRGLSEERGPLAA